MGNKHFGYRVRDEIVFYMLENKIAGLLSEDNAFDYQIMQKVLPIITGSEYTVKEILIQLFNFRNPSCEIADGTEYLEAAEKFKENALYIESADKIIKMLRGYEDGFALSGDNVNIISIRTDDFTLNFMGSISNKKAEAIKANLNIPAFIKVISDEYLDVETRTLCTNGELEVKDGYNMFPCFFEDGIYQIWLEKNTESSIEIYHISSDIRKKITSIGRNLIGAFSFSGEIGYTTFKIKKQGRIVLALTIEVFPTKVDYRKDYFEIINDVNEEIASLAFEFLGKTYHSSGLSDVKHQTAAEFVNILKIIFENLERALIRIERNPKHIMLNSDMVNKFEKAKKPSRNSLNYLRKHPHVLVKSSRGFINISQDKYIPTQLLENKKITTIDIFENRYVKYILKSIIKRLSIIRNTVQINYGVDNEYYTLICNLKKKLEFHLNSFFKNIGELTGRKSMSLVFQMAPGYKQVYYNYMLLKKGLTLSEDIYNITPKKLWKLYEIWCYMKLHNILKNMGMK
ncbi:DUF2357 domain-containing protein [Clostridium tagluense]|uniref:DUF2357 domain-containing protein n=2 Tax=Clostridium tagluense TaxID=360422 RepID=UPI001CF3E325|nr:DUF2357 domain-containing protein [Clostridium tagluense]MCB2313453.1 DUF2357 domain-containing protein [Clostridium tagluense]MCB2323082.1 DUF2357 domain-containing protein [Clostridium tagluense]MCB2337709.1 DUF2357 domain-containing protein [Clostridium tagluense]MCB2366570.1 DUF2357 domain-containing protein [Clostridium tagluense]